MRIKEFSYTRSSVSPFESEYYSKRMNTLRLFKFLYNWKPFFFFQMSSMRQKIYVNVFTRIRTRNRFFRCMYIFKKVKAISLVHNFYVRCCCCCCHDVLVFLVSIANAFFFFWKINLFYYSSDNFFYRHHTTDWQEFFFFCYSLVTRVKEKGKKKGGKFNFKGEGVYIYIRNCNGSINCFLFVVV